MSINDKWDAMEPEKRQQLVKGGVVMAVIGVAMLLYYGTGRDEKVAVEKTEPLQVISLGEERLEDDVRATVEAERQEQQNVNQKQDETLRSQTEQMAALAAEIAALKAAEQSFKAMPESLDMPEAPPETEQSPSAPPNYPNQWASTPATGQGDMGPVVEFVGGIGTLINDQAPGDVGGAGDKKKAGRRFYLPPSLMEAKTLTGLNAKTVEGSSQNPEPMALRIQAPAVLPNEVTAELEGCFVVAHGYGSLASERIEARTVSLSCVDFEGRSKIDAEIQGVVLGGDSVKGLPAHPVSKMGTNLSRLMLAGFVEGAGDAFAEQGTITNTSSLGQTQVIDSSQIGKAGIGKGVSKAADELTKIYVELVRQSAPVLELGPAVDAAIFITKGVWLEVTDYENAG